MCFEIQCCLPATSCCNIWVIFQLGEEFIKDLAYSEFIEQETEIVEFLIRHVVFDDASGGVGVAHGGAGAPQVGAEAAVFLGQGVLGCGAAPSHNGHRGGENVNHCKLGLHIMVCVMALKQR